MQKLKDICEAKKIPLIFVLANSYDEENYSIITKNLNQLGINDIIPVLAKKRIININNKIFEIKSKNLEQLVKLSFDKGKNSCFISFKKSLEERIFDNIINKFNDSHAHINNSTPNSEIKNNNSSDKEEKQLILLLII